MALPMFVRRAFALALLAATMTACGAQSGGALPTATAPAPSPTALPPSPTAPTAVPVTPTVAPAIPIAVAQTTVQRFLESYFAGGDAQVYLGGSLAAEVAAGRPLHQLVGSQPGYRGFVVHEPERLADETIGVWADITYGDTVVEHRFELAPSLGEWVIVGIDIGNSRPSEGAPGGGEWRGGYSGDLTGDGVPEQISYKEATLQLPPVGFSDPSIVSLNIASELTVRMEAAPGGRELLYLNPAALMAEGVLLASFEDRQPAGFLVVTYGGESHRLHITPLTAEGQPLGDMALEAVWSHQENGYRLK